MRAKVINGFYSFEKGRIMEKNETIEVGEERGRELIALGLIVETPKEEPAAPVIDENGNFSVDGDAVGHVEGDNIVITDPEVIKETLKEAPATTEEKTEKKAKK